MNSELGKAKYIEALTECLGNVSKASEMVGISRITHYNWCKNDIEYKAKVDEIQDISLDYVEDKLMGCINNEDLTAIIFYLKSKGKSRGWTDRQAIDATIHIDPPLFPDATVD